MLDPHEIASPSSRNPNSDHVRCDSGDVAHDSRARVDEVDLEIAIRDGIHRVRGHAIERERRTNVRAIDRQ